MDSQPELHSQPGDVNDATLAYLGVAGGSILERKSKFWRDASGKKRKSAP